MEEKTKINHLAIIPDGNRRWAKLRGRSSLYGHQKGAERVIELLRYGRRKGIHTMTVWGLSTGNFNNRPKEELKYLFQLFADFIDRYKDDTKKDNVRFVHLGRKDRLPDWLVEKLKKLEEETRNNKDYLFNLGFDYGGRDEIVRMAKKIVERKISTDEISEETVAKLFDTGDEPYPDPDLIVRTSGEQRMSGFMSWQASAPGTEIYFEKSFFPDLTPEKLDQAIANFGMRTQRLGA